MTLALVFPDHVLRERLQFTLVKTPGLISLFYDELTPSLIADCIVVPAEQYLSLGEFDFKSPIICYGGDALLKTAFQYGCFDYLKDPWVGNELIARINRISRLHLERFEITLHGSSLIGPNKSIELTEKEAAIFFCLKEANGSIVSREILELKCKIESSSISRSLDMLISRLRKKLIMILIDSGYFSSLKSIRNEGYRLTSFSCGHVVDKRLH